MSEWKEIKIDQLCEAIVDCVNKTAPIVDEITPYRMIRTTNVKDGRIDLSSTNYVTEDVFRKWTRRSTLQEGDIILTREAPLGEVGKIIDGENLFLGQRLMMYRPASDIVDPDFLFYAFLSKEVQYQIKSFGMGSTVEHMRVGDCSEIIVKVPSLQEQREIGKTLSILDRKISNLRQQNETLEAIAQTLFKHWFVDFEFPNEDGKPYKSSGGEMVRSELGDIPAGWRVVKVEEIADRISMGPFGSRITTDNFVDSGVPVIRGGNLVNGFNEKAFVFLTEEKANELKSSNAFSEDIVFTHRGTLGQVGFIPTHSQYPRYVVSQSQMLLGVNKNLASSRFVYRFFCSQSGLNAILANTNTTGVPSIGRPTTTLKSIQIVLPEEKVMCQFDSLIKAIDFKKEANGN